MTMTDEQLSPQVDIVYCTQCRWLMRAGWMAQELLTTFERELGAVRLVPGEGGIFEVWLEGERIWSRKDEGRFPELKELKQRLRDHIAPQRDLGHSDRHSGDGSH
jgi:selenoprotein W-related protein